MSMIVMATNSNESVKEHCKVVSAAAAYRASFSGKDVYGIKFQFSISLPTFPNMA